MSIENYLQFLSSNLNLSLENLRSYFVHDLYGVQDFLIGSGTYILGTNETISITRVYFISEDDNIEFEESPEYYDSVGVLNGPYGGIYVTPGTNLDYDNIGGFYSQLELWEDIQLLQQKLGLAIENALINSNNEILRNIILKHTINLIDDCKNQLLSMSINLTNKKILQEEQFIIDSFVMSFGNLNKELSDVQSLLFSSHNSKENSQLFQAPIPKGLDEMLDVPDFKEAYELLIQIGFLLYLKEKNLKVLSTLTLVGSLANLSLHEFSINTELVVNQKEYYILADRIGLIKYLTEYYNSNSDKMATFLVKISKIGMEKKYVKSNFVDYYKNRANKGNAKDPFLYRKSVEKIEKFISSLL